MILAIAAGGSYVDCVSPVTMAAPFQLSNLLAIADGGTTISPTQLTTSTEEQTPLVKSLKTDPDQKIVFKSNPLINLPIYVTVFSRGKRLSLIIKQYHDEDLKKKERLARMVAGEFSMKLVAERRQNLCEEDDARKLKP
ncbi:hypothetical protein HKD37_10G027314 [Glycine soja]